MIVSKYCADCAALTGLAGILDRLPRAAQLRSLARGYHLSGFQPFQFEPRYLGCYRLSIEGFSPSSDFGAIGQPLKMVLDDKLNC
jgi:hypothetical protein